jgi:hypothetical protein
LFQVCLAAAVANLTLIAATCNPWLGSGLEVLGWSLVIPAATLSLSHPHLDGGVPRSLCRR